MKGTVSVTANGILAETFGQSNPMAHPAHPAHAAHLAHAAYLAHPAILQALHVPVPTPVGDPDQMVVRACVLALIVLPFLLGF